MIGFKTVYTNSRDKLIDSCTKCVLLDVLGTTRPGDWGHDGVSVNDL